MDQYEFNLAINRTSYYIQTVLNRNRCGRQHPLLLTHRRTVALHSIPKDISHHTPQSQFDGFLERLVGRVAHAITPGALGYYRLGLLFQSGIIGVFQVFKENFAK